MKRTIVSTVISAVFLVALALFMTSSSRQADADLGNTGTPVRSYLVCAASGEECFFSWVYPDGTMWSGDPVVVPAGYYLLITDIVITPSTNEDQGKYRLNFFVIQGDEIMGGLDILDENAIETRSIHYTTPFFILPGGSKIGVTTGGLSTEMVSIGLSGLLVTNVTYLPVIVH